MEDRFSIPVSHGQALKVAVKEGGKTITIILIDSGGNTIAGPKQFSSWDEFGNWLIGFLRCSNDNSPSSCFANNPTPSRRHGM